jgi:hypothetical protein
MHIVRSPIATINEEADDRMSPAETAAAAARGADDVDPSRCI